MNKKHIIFLIILMLFGYCLDAKEPYTIYFAGDLFDHKDLTGNALLAQALEELDKNRYKSVLPQDLEQNIKDFDDPIKVRNMDIATLMGCDLALFNFDGTDLDSGTVVEFMIAKMLDIPSVVVRTDFRKCGDIDAIPWNLMVYGYPRTAVVRHHSLHSYAKGIHSMHRSIAVEVHRGFESVLSTPTVFLKSEDIMHAYITMLALCGSELSKYLSQEQISDIVKRKINKGLYK